jgi:hypothetical protein
MRDHADEQDVQRHGSACLRVLSGPAKGSGGHGRAVVRRALSLPPCPAHHACLARAWRPESWAWRWQAEVGGVRLLVAAMRAHQGSAPLVWEACTALRKLAGLDGALSVGRGGVSWAGRAPPCTMHPPPRTGRA